MARTRSFFATRTGIIVVGVLLGTMAALLQRLGNPPNMGVCVACFSRDIVGALGFHRAGIVQYLRPAAHTAHWLNFGGMILAGLSFTLAGGCPGRQIFLSGEGDADAAVFVMGMFVGAAVSPAPCRDDGTMPADAVEALIQPNTWLIVINHASNVCGTVLPIRAIGEIARERNVPLLVDAAQTAGCLPIDMEADNVNLLAFSGHKGLLGPSGTGGLVIHPEFDVARIPAMMHGGTGSGSERETQPDFLPDKLESGTPNIVGIAGLAAGLRYLHECGVERIQDHERNLTQRLIDGLIDIQRVRVLGTQDARQQASAVSFTVDGLSPSGVAQVLDERFGIMSRPGLQCAPCAHRTLGTLPEGTIRLSAGVFTTEAEIEQVIDAVAQLTKES